METKQFENIEFRFDSGIVEIVLNRPEALNALNDKLTQDLKEAFSLCENEAVKVVVLSANGKGFSSGGDIKMMAELDKNPKALTSLLDNLHSVIIQMRNLDKPIIAAINGFAFGAGFSLALACDFRVASKKSSFSCAFVNIGLIPDSGASFFLTKLLGVTKATELMMLGNTINAEQANDLGLLNYLVEPEEVAVVAKKLASELSKKPSTSIARIKKLVNKAIIADLPDQLHLEAMFQGEAAKTANFREGITAFLEKRLPNFN